MKHKGYASRHWVNAYLLSLIVVAWALLGLGGAIYVACVRDTSEWLIKLLIYVFPCMIYGACCAIKSYDIFGRVTMEADRFVLTAPLRKPIIYELSAIQHVQMDYSLLSTSRQFWVVIGSEPIPDRYMHKINEMPITPVRLKLQYTPALDEQLERLLTGRLYQAYSRAKSTLRAYRAG